MTPKKLTSLRASDETRDQLEKLAADLDASQAEVIALAVDAFYQKRQAQKLASQLIDLLNKNGIRASEGDHLVIDAAPDGTLTIRRSGSGVFGYTITADGRMVEQQSGQFDDVTIIQDGE